MCPTPAPQAGNYTFDVAQAAKGGSAGSVSLILQTVLLPLALAEGTSKLTLRGGTHVSWSPAFDYIKRVYLPTLTGQAGLKAKANIRKWGWYPLGGGEVQVTVQGSTEGALLALDRQQRGNLVRVTGTVGQQQPAQTHPHSAGKSRPPGTAFERHQCPHRRGGCTIQGTGYGCLCLG